MTHHSEQILKDAMALPPKERVELAERLLSSLDLSTQQDIDKLWAEECERRIDAYDQGKIKTISAEDVFNKIDKYLKS